MVKKFEQFSDDQLIAKSLIHPNIKVDLKYDKVSESYEWESDFMFGFIESIMKRLKLQLPKEDDDFEWQCYEWCMRYFSKYLDIKADIISESGYFLYTRNEEEKNNAIEEYKESNQSGEQLKLDIDSEVLNKITGKLYFD